MNDFNTYTFSWRFYLYLTASVKDMKSPEKSKTENKIDKILNIFLIQEIL